MDVPFVDLKKQYLGIKHEIKDALDKILESSQFVLGEETKQFEQEFADYCQAKYCVAVHSGTAALHLALLAYGIGVGDEVITVPNTFIATCEAISYTGAKPVFVDIDAKTYNIDVSKIESAITDKTRAILPVHLYGHPADLDPILETAQNYNLLVIEDACQAHGAEYKGKRVGCIGDIGCFSFYPSKLLGAYGQGGAILTNDEEIDKKLRMFREHGQAEKYYHDVIGYNYRMDGFQGAVLRVKLRYLDKWIEAHRKNASLYNNFLTDSNVILSTEAEFAKSVYHLYVVRVKDRDRVQKVLSENGIRTGIHYLVPIHLQKAYQHLGAQVGDFPVTEECAKEILSLPMHPDLEVKQIEYVVDVLKKATSRDTKER